MATNKMSSKIEAASDGLAKAPAKSRVKKSMHMQIEPTDNKGFIVKHEEHHDGMPTGKRKHHVFSDAAAMHKHVMKTYPAKAVAVPAEEAPAEPEEQIPGSGV